MAAATYSVRTLAAKVKIGCGHDDRVLMMRGERPLDTQRFGRTAFCAAGHHFFFQVRRKQLPGKGCTD